MIIKKNYKNYTSQLNTLLNQVDTELIQQTVKIIKKKIKSKSKIYLVGNGGSSSIANHVSVDFTKSAGVKSLTFNNSNLITCFANDYGHENWVTEAIKAFCSKKDLIILISSSGNSMNIINAAKYCKKNDIDFITLSGFSEKNKLRKMGKVNFYVKSKDYNFVEMTHHIILLNIVDLFAKKIV